MVRRSLLLVAAVTVAISALLSACGGGSSDASEAKLSAAGERGKEVARKQGCISCHTADGEKSTGPTWQGLAGSQVALEDGSTVVADDDYLRNAILASRGQVVKGYANVMPVYEGEISEADLQALLAYLHDLAPSDDAPGGN